jgi:hypothetical protein
MFSSPTNKEMIWGLLKEQSKFPLNNQWRKFFELTFENVEKRQGTYPDLVAMNKHLISICIEELNKFSINVPKTLLKSKSGIQNTFKQKQDDIKQMQNGYKPKDIDFSDKNDQSYGNIHHLMNQTIADRQKELEKITTRFQSNSKEAQKWLNREEHPKLSIDKETNKKIETIPISKKKVSFNLNPYSLKINYTEDGVNKDMRCRLGSDFKLFTAVQSEPDNQNIILESIELYTK